MVNNRWIRSSGTLNKHPINIQYRDNWQDVKAAGLHSTCVQIAWHAHEVDSATGFPPLAEQIDILALGEQLVSLEANDNCILAMIIAHEGINQWVIYVQDLEQFNKDLLALPEPDGGYPIEMVANADADWSSFTQVYQVIAQLT